MKTYLSLCLKVTCVGFLRSINYSTQSLFVVMNKLQIYGIKFVSLKPSGAPLTSGAPGLCPPTTYGCYATAGCHPSKHTNRGCRCLLRTGRSGSLVLLYAGSRPQRLSVLNALSLSQVNKRECHAQKQKSTATNKKSFVSKRARGRPPSKQKMTTTVKKSLVRKCGQLKKSSRPISRRRSKTQIYTTRKISWCVFGGCSFFVTSCNHVEIRKLVD